MTDEPQPDLRWAPLEPKPRNRGRIWLIVGLVVAALVIVGVLLFFLLPRGDSPTPGASGSPSPSASVSPSSSPSSSPTPTQTEVPQPTVAPEPSTPITTPPPVADPSVEAFRGQVQGWLEDALTGLQIVGETSGQDAVSVVDSLQADAQRLSETPAPSSIEAAWGERLAAYAQTLTELRADPAAAGAIERSRGAANELRALVGL